MHPRYLMTGTRVWNLSHTITVKGAKIVDGKLNVQVINTDASASSVSVTTIGFESTVVKASIKDNKNDRETATAMISVLEWGEPCPELVGPHYYSSLYSMSSSSQNPNSGILSKPPAH
jgi:hypothetical protein